MKIILLFVIVLIGVLCMAILQRNSALERISELGEARDKSQAMVREALAERDEARAERDEMEARLGAQPQLAEAVKSASGDATTTLAAQAWEGGYQTAMAECESRVQKAKADALIEDAALDRLHCYQITKPDGFDLPISGGDLVDVPDSPGYVWLMSPDNRKPMLKIPKSELRSVNLGEAMRVVVADLQAMGYRPE